MSMLVKKAQASAEAGFTLIELMIVIAIILDSLYNFIMDCIYREYTFPYKHGNILTV